MRGMSGRWITVAMLAALIACGDGITVGPDATRGTADERGLVSVQLLADRSLSGTADVFFQRPDGTLALATRTDGAGRANALVPPGGTVTIGVQTGSVYWLYTYLDVQLGDAIVLDLRRLPSLRTFTLDVPTDPGSETYSAHAACDGYTYVVGLWLVSNQVTLDLLDCAGPGELLVLSSHPERGLGYLFTTFEATDTHLTLAGTYAPYARSEISLRAPSSFTRAQVRQRVGAVSLATSVSLDQGAGATQLQLPLAAGATLVTQLELWGKDLLPQAVTAWGPVSNRTEVELASLLRPITAIPTFDFAQRTLRWTEGDEGELGDAVAARVEYYRVETDTTYRWTILGPRRAEPEIRFPRLPDAALHPRPDDFPTVLGLALIALDGGGYDRIRTRLLGRWRPQEAWPIDAATGTVRLQAWGTF